MTIQVQESPDSMAIDVRVENPASVLADFSKNTIVVELQSNTTIDIIVQKENTQEFEQIDVINCDFISLNADDFGKSITIYDVVNFQM